MTMAIPALESHEEEFAQLKYLLEKTTEKVLRLIEANPENAPVSGASPRSPNELRELLKKRGFHTPQTGHRDDRDAILSQIDTVLEHSPNTWSLGFMAKLYGSTTPIGVVADLVLLALNANSHVYSAAPVLTIAEKMVSRSYAGLFYPSHGSAGGLTFPGGSWSNVTSMHMARTKIAPDTQKTGNSDKRLVAFCSEAAHYSVIKSAVLCGIGSDNVVKIRCDEYGKMRCDELESRILESIKKGQTPFYVCATAGTTVFGAFDDINQIAVISKKYGLWLHVDGSLGGNFIFSKSLKNRLTGCEKADTITVNPHKLLGVPLLCSFLLTGDESLFKLNRLDAPYLFHEGMDYDLGQGTLGCGRRPDAFKLYMAWYYYGTDGFAARINHVKTIADYFARALDRKSCFRVVNKDKDGLVPGIQVCFYYVPVSGLPVSTLGHITRAISGYLSDQMTCAIDYSPPVGQDGGEFLRAVFLNPKLSLDYTDKLVMEIEEAGEIVWEKMDTTA